MGAVCQCFVSILHAWPMYSCLPISYDIRKRLLDNALDKPAKKWSAIRKDSLFQMNFSKKSLRTREKTAKGLAMHLKWLADANEVMSQVQLFVVQHG